MARIDLNLIGTIEYPYIQAWGKILGSLPGYIADEIGRARADGAPQTAIYRETGGDRGWRTVDDIESDETKERVKRIVRHIQYRYMYDRTVGSADCHGKEETTRALAQLAYALKYDGADSKEDACWVALELFEEMTGLYWDPTQAELDHMKASIIG